MKNQSETTNAEVGEAVLLHGIFRVPWDQFGCWESFEVEELESRIAIQLRHRDGMHKEKMAEMQEKYSH